MRLDSFETQSTPVKIKISLVSFGLFFAFAHIATINITKLLQLENRLPSISALQPKDSTSTLIKGTPEHQATSLEIQIPVMSETNQPEFTPTLDNPRGAQDDVTGYRPADAESQLPQYEDALTISELPDSPKQNVIIIDSISDIEMSKFPPNYKLELALEVENINNPYSPNSESSPSALAPGTQQNGEQVIVVDVNTLSDVVYSERPPNSNLE